MNKHGIRIAACALAGTFALSGYYTSLQAKINQSSTLPAAGIAVVLEEGTTIQELTQEVIQNIAYLESASGIQPNIIIASEKVAMAETPMQEEATVDSDVVQALVDSVSGDNTDNDEAKSITDSLSAGFSATDTYEDTTEESSEESSEESQTETVEEETSEDTEEETTEEATEEETTEVATEEEQDFRGLVIAQVNNYVNVRSIPSEDGEIVGKLYDKSVGEFEEEVNGWYKITSGNCTGYVKAEYCVTGDEAQALAKQVGTTYAVVNTTTLKVRQEASTESAVLGLVPIEEELVVVEELDGWVKVAIEEGDGYVSREYVNLRTDFVHAESKAEEEARLAEEAKEREEARAAAAATEATRAAQAAEQTVQKQAQTEAVIEAAQATAASSAGSEMGKSVIDYATQFVGNPYVYGGSSLTDGADCSGFVMAVYAQFGYSLPHSAGAQSQYGTRVDTSSLEPGDILFYGDSSIEHCAIYIGDGMIVHASTEETGIKISSAFYRDPLCAVRIIGQQTSCI